MKQRKLFRRIYFRIWLALCWARNADVPGVPNSFGRQIKRLVGAVVALALVLSMGYYVLGPNSRMDAIAATTPSLPSSLAADEKPQDTAGFLQTVKSIWSSLGNKSAPQTAANGAGKTSSTPKLLNIKETSLDEQFKAAENAAENTGETIELHQTDPAMLVRPSTSEVANATVQASEEANKPAQAAPVTETADAEIAPEPEVAQAEIQLADAKSQEEATRAAAIEVNQADESRAEENQAEVEQAKSNQSKVTQEVVEETTQPAEKSDVAVAAKATPAALSQGAQADEETTTSGDDVPTQWDIPSAPEIAAPRAPQGTSSQPETAFGEDIQFAGVEESKPAESTVEPKQPVKKQPAKLQIAPTKKQEALAMAGAETLSVRNMEQIETADTQTASGKEPAKVQSPAKQAAPESALEHAKKHMNKKYVCPMHPKIVKDDPKATCPICGMALVELKNTSEETGIVQLSPAVINALGVKTSMVKKRTLYRRVESIGYIAYDEERIRNVNLRTEGWIEKLNIKSQGERVSKGELLMEVYSPKLVNAQEEFIQALEVGSNGLVKASAERLLSLGVSREQIEQLQHERKVQQYVRIYAPQSGNIAELSVREGQFVPTSTPVLKLVDLSTVWLVADVFERQADWIKVGQKAKATLPFMPGKEKEGVVEFVYPDLDPKTRSLKVRLRFDNSDGALKPNMYADLTIFAEGKRNTLAVPTEAVIYSGDDTRVILSADNGRFKPARVKLGIESGGNIEVLDGLTEGQMVVRRAQFLIDSESNIQASMLRMAE